ncbi:homing endonuclease [Acinetobacter phage Morttis]|nr:homing endonuclease [Acinetobacter phage Maestro]QQM18720.1 homing endonuclease [Acinetobacter phage Morttis]
MNYSRIYDQLISRAVSRNLEGYGEWHHILPRSLGGSDERENLVFLTPREHFIAHKLLYAINPTSRSLQFAFAMMSHTRKNIKVSSRDYELGKRLISEARAGVPLSDEHRKAISAGSKGKRLTEDTIERMRKPKTKEHAKNISLSKVGALNPMYGTISPTRDIPHSDKSRALISERTKAATDFPACPHCGKKVNKGNALRWHYDNCKFKVN